MSTSVAYRNWLAWHKRKEPLAMWKKLWHLVRAYRVPSAFTEQMIILEIDEMPYSYAANAAGMRDAIRDIEYCFLVDII